MLNRSRVPKARSPGKFRQAVEAMRPAAPTGRAALRRRPGRLRGEAAGGILRLALVLAAVCAFLLLMDRLGVSPATVADFPLAD